MKAGKNFDREEALNILENIGYNREGMENCLDNDGLLHLFGLQVKGK